MARNSPLCKRCKVLEFDDKALGASIGTLKTGERYAVFKPNFSMDLGYLYELPLEYNLKDTFPDLPVLAAEQCGMCALIRNQFLDKGKFRVSRLTTLEIIRFRLCFRLSRGEDEIQRPDALSVVYTLDNFVTSHIVFGIQADPADPCFNWLSLFRRPIASSVLSESGISRITEMVEGAISRSDLAAEERYLPTRLVHVGDEQHEPRLVVSKTHRPFLMENKGCNANRYIALSYCWGSRTEAEQQLKTTRDSFENHMERIPTEALPQTLLDAVLVCRALGVQYLWVDVLCIIQGDKLDWERESASMAKVYSHSFLTICAAQGDSCQSGFLKRHPPSQVEVPFHSSLDPSVSGKYSLVNVPKLQCTMILDHNRTIVDDPFMVDVGYSSWNRRGWTFQEVKLSPRALIFGTNMAHLVSATNDYEAEDGERESSLRTMGPSLKHQLYEPGPEFRCSVIGPLYGSWYSLVELYTSRSLTYHEDILIAISAVAKRYYARAGAEYLAGLWSDDLHRGLMWASTGCNGDRSDMKTTYTAPSWSWACQSRPVTFLEISKSQKAKVLFAETSFTIDPYGRVTGGFILLWTKVCRIPSTTLTASLYFAHEVNFESRLVSHEGKYIIDVLLDQRYKSEEHLISQMSMVLVSDDGLGRMLGLLVLPTATQEEYRRAGLFRSKDVSLGGAKFWDDIETTTIKLV